MSYYLTVEYPAELYFSNDLDPAIYEAVGAESDGSGCGFGMRDIGFTFDTEAEAKAAATRAKTVHKKIKCSVFEMNYED
jgi:hypothetical protein